MSTLFILDIDGTLAHAGRRIDKAGPEPTRHIKETYDAWVTRINAGMGNDSPVPGMRDLCTLLSRDAGFGYLVYLTSREDKYFSDTAQWLFDHGFPMEQLIMRPEGNIQEGAVFKERVINLAKYQYKADAVVVVDDDGRGEIEEMCSKNGFTFLKARSGGQK